MSLEVSRRSVARATLWSVPAVVVASAAPAVAASCVPSTVMATTVVQFASTKTLFDTTPDGKTQLHTVQYTFTNNGPDEISANVELVIKVTVVTDIGQVNSLSLDSTSDNVSATVANSSSDDAATNKTTNVGTVTVTTAQPIAKDGTFVVTVLAKIGYERESAVQEEVTIASPQSVTDAETCTTTTLEASTDGVADGSSYMTFM